MSTPIRIVQLYPEQLGITGDRGNVNALRVRLERAGTAVEVHSVRVGDPLPADMDIVVLGNGPLSAMRGVLDDLGPRAAQLNDFIDAGGSLLAVGGSAELLSHGVDLLDGSRVDGLGIMPFSVTRTRERKVGYILVDTADGRVVGFEDHASSWQLDADAVRYGVVIAGRGSFEYAGSQGEIVRRDGAFATNVQGPVLPLNPGWTDVILARATARRGVEWSVGTAHAQLDEYAGGARSAIEGLVHGKDISSIGL